MGSQAQPGNQLKHLSLKNLTTPTLLFQGNRGFKASLLVGERFGERFLVYILTFQTSSYRAFGKENQKREPP
jgi:hypothetical protein